MLSSYRRLFLATHRKSSAAQILLIQKNVLSVSKDFGFGAKGIHETSHNRKDDKDSWWFQRLTKAEKLDTPSQTQSTLLSELDSVYELQFHRVKPSHMQNYLEESARFVDMMTEKKTGAELQGSWTCMIGDQDEAVHLWKYKGGYPQFNKATMIYRTDPEIIKYRLNRNEMLRSRYNQILLRFAFWEFKKERDPGNMFEMRSYVLKPGSTIEWGNHWARGLKYRQENNAAVCGFFSHIGDLYMCHHLWAYKDLQSRKETRDSAWSRPGWDENVRYTDHPITLKDRLELKFGENARIYWGVCTGVLYSMVSHQSTTAMNETPRAPILSLGTDNIFSLLVDNAAISHRMILKKV